MPVLGLVIFLCTDWLTYWLPVYIGWLITSTDDNEDSPHSRSTTWTWGTCQTATARIPLTRAPLGDWRYPSPLATISGSLPRSPKAYFKPLWPFRSSPLDSSEVPLARKDNQPRATDQAEHSRFPILLLLSNKYFGTSYCFGPSITPPSLDRKSNRTTRNCM